MQKRIANYESISSVVGLVENALLVALAGQRYIRRVLGQPDSTRAIEKGVTTSANAPGGTTIDFVTEADYAVQEIAENIFFHPNYATKCFSVKNNNNDDNIGNSSSSSKNESHAKNENKFVVPAIAFIGEETLPMDPLKSELHHFAWFEDVCATEASQEYHDLLVELRCACRVITPPQSHATSKVGQGINNHTDQNDADEAEGESILSNASVTPPNEVDNTLLGATNNNNNLQTSTTTTQSFVPTVQIYVDPIDGTNAMVSGKKKVPMTLIGICLGGVPVAGVINRVFAGDGTYILNRDFKMSSTTQEGEKNNKKSRRKKQSNHDGENKNKCHGEEPCPSTISLCIEGGPCWIDGRRVVSVQSMDEDFQQAAFENFINISNLHNNNNNNAAAHNSPTTPTSVQQQQQENSLPPCPSSISAFRNKKLNILAGSNGKARHDLIYRYLEPAQWFETRGAGHKLLALASGASILGEHERVLKSHQNIAVATASMRIDSRLPCGEDQQKEKASPPVDTNSSVDGSAHEEHHSFSHGAVPRAVKIESDSMPRDIIFDAFVAKGQVTKWDTAAPHAFLRWLNADVFRIIDVLEKTDHVEGHHHHHNHNGNENCCSDEAKNKSKKYTWMNKNNDSNNNNINSIIRCRSGKPVLKFIPIDYAERSGNLKKFNGFDVSLEPRIIATINPVMTSMIAERLRAAICVCEDEQFAFGNNNNNGEKKNVMNSKL